MLEVIQGQLHTFVWTERDIQYRSVQAVNLFWITSLKSARKIRKQDYLRNIIFKIQLSLDTQLNFKEVLNIDGQL